MFNQMNLGVLKIFYVEQTSNLIGREAFEAIVQEADFFLDMFFLQKVRGALSLSYSRKKGKYREQIFVNAPKTFYTQCHQTFWNICQFFFQKSISFIFLIL